MKLIDKIKNAFFEDEEFEDDEDTQDLAKKIEVPKKKNPLSEISFKKKIEFDEEESDVEEEEVKLKNKPEEHEEISIPEEEPKIEEQEPFFEEEEINNKITMFEDEDFTPTEEIHTYRETRKEEKKELYPDKKESSYIESVKGPGYSQTTEYYESRTKSTKFKPSPIISPIYGILDKNYRKEEVITKKEIHISYGKANLDEVRDKAFGSNEKKKTEPPKEVKKEEPKEEKKEIEEDIYDVNHTKPKVSGVTIADADEYYNDLGLAYNVDYNDDSRSSASRSKSRQDNKSTKEEDNLFDLIESMYDKED